MPLQKKKQWKHSEKDNELGLLELDGLNIRRHAQKTKIKKVNNSQTRNIVTINRQNPRFFLQINHVLYIKFRVL